jgi:hypothetical protein
MEKLLFPSFQVDEIVPLTKHKEQKRDSVESLKKYHEEALIAWSTKIFIGE